MIIIERANHFDIYTPYNPDFLAEMKTVIPYRSRVWLDKERAWRIGKEHRAELMRILHEWFESVEMFSPGSPSQQSQSPPPHSPYSGRPHSRTDCLADVCKYWPDHAVLMALPNAPAEVLNACYRVLALIHHPDKGGAHDAMVRLNKAYERTKAML